LRALIVVRKLQTTLASVILKASFVVPEIHGPDGHCIQEGEVQCVILLFLSLGLCIGSRHDVQAVKEGPEVNKDGRPFRHDTRQLGAF